MARNVYVRGHYRRTPRRRSSAGDEIVATVVGWLILVCLGLALLAWLVTQWWAWVAAVGLGALAVHRRLRARAEAQTAALAAQLAVQAEAEAAALAAQALAERRAAEYAAWQVAEAQRQAALEEAERLAAEEEAERRARAPRSRYIPNHVKIAAANATNGLCAHCGGDDDLAFDHIIPFNRGGSSTDPTNIQILCRSCNSSKRDRFVG